MGDTMWDRTTLGIYVLVGDVIVGCYQRYTYRLAGLLEDEAVGLWGNDTD